jgi:hypothetical protein
MTWARRKDGTHQIVVNALKACGWVILDVSRAPLAIDLIIAKAGRTVLVEIKAPKGKLTKDQETILKCWPAEVAVLRSVEDVLKLSASVPPSFSPRPIREESQSKTPTPDL